MSVSKVTNAPLVLSEPDEISWDDEADIVVVGLGSAGAVAGLQAIENGATVIAVDRFDGGGATAYSGGIIYAGGTRQQRDAGFQDNSDEMYKYLSAEGTPLRDDTLRRFCEGSHLDIEWLESLGVRYGGNVYKEKTNYPPNDYFLYYSGNEKSPAFKDKAKPVPRGHRPIGKGFAGKHYFRMLKEAVDRSGMKVLTHSPVTRLVTDSEGKVIGVEINALPKSLWERHQKLYRMVSPWLFFNNIRAEKAIVNCRKLEQCSEQRRLLRARNGVILAAGGFIYNLDMLRKQQPMLGQNYKTLLRLGSMGDDGSGIALGESVGGVTGLMDSIFTCRTIAPPIIFPRGIVVNKLGERFVNEDAYNGILGKAVAKQPEMGEAWLILDAKTFWTAVRQSLFPGKGLFVMWGVPALLNMVMGGTRRGRSLQALATACNIDASGLERTVSDYNAVVSAQQPDPFGKMPTLLSTVKGSSYYAINISLTNKYAPMITVTMGGLRVDEDSGNVKGADENIIPGLYAAGRTAVGICSKGYISGLSIADTVFSGRRAGRAAAVGIGDDSANTVD